VVISAPPPPQAADRLSQAPLPYPPAIHARWPGARGEQHQHRRGEGPKLLPAAVERWRCRLAGSRRRRDKSERL